MEHLEHKKEKRNERAAIQLGLFLVGLLLFGTAAGGQLTEEEKNGKEKAAIQTSGGVSDAAEPKKIALTFDDDVIIGLSQEISYKEAVSMI